ncbi:MAG: sodium:solute symporter [Candidatus Marinimicrobia bacterium]|nr:sodium:solute symporter [Candidatus Neomarinimicrobiota bacterium]
MTILDFSIVGLYLVGMIWIGLYFSKKASSDIDSYFLGSRSLPWWVLGASGMASNLDISGTMINTAFIYALGAMGFFVEIRGGIVLIMAFLMIFMGKWNRRSEVMTLAEWMKLRFGDGIEGKIARLIAAISVLVSSTAIVTYFAVGAGKFIGEFLGIPPFFGLPSQFWAATLMILLAMIYTVASGLYGVVWTDVFQGFLIFFTIITICVISLVSFDIPDVFSISIPLRDGGYQAVETTKDAWTNFLPNWRVAFPENSSYSIFNLFGLTIIFYLLKTVIEGSAGTSGYMIQRFFAAKSDRDAGLLSMFWTFLLSLRWPFVAAIAIMGISLGVKRGQPIQDPEAVLPIVINTLVPVGLKGLLVAGLMAAGMSTFDSVINSGAAYWVKDIYQAFINPKASEKQLLLHSRMASVLMVIFGLFVTLAIKNINDIYSWITMSIGAGLIIPLLLRWYWWRLNGFGFALGTLGGMIAAIVQKLVFPNWPDYIIFTFTSGISLIATITGTFLTQPTDDVVLLNFYKKTRPFGFWDRVRCKIPSDKLQQINSENRRDIIAVIFAVPWQLALFLTVMMTMMERWDLFGLLLVLFLFLSFGLYWFWFRHLSSEVKIDP